MEEVQKVEENRYAFLPIKYPLLMKYYHDQKNVFWAPSEIDHSNDRTSWDKMDDDMKNYTKFLLALFAQLDGIVNENLAEYFIQETSFCKECSAFYAMQAAIEWIHNETYSNLIMAFIRDEEERLRMLNSINTIPAIKMIADWAFKYMDAKIPILERVVAFCCIEGIIFSSAFAGIYWLKRKNVLPGLCKANEWIARDEGLHTQFGVALYHHMTSIWKKYDALPHEKIKEIISSAVEITEKFTRTAMNCDLVGLSSDEMVSYVKATADKLSDSLGYGSLFNVENKLTWMVIISLPNKTNFFESKVSEYAREEESNFDFEEDYAY